MNTKLKLLDLFCGAGGASMGYHLAGFDVVGVDINPQPHYPFDFYQADAFEFFNEHWQDFDIYHASPKCQGHSKTIHIHKNKPWSPVEKHIESKNQIEIIKKLFVASNKPYIIENVPGSKKYLENPITLRGNMFNLRVIRDRVFETNPYIIAPPLIPVKGTTNSHRGLSTGGEYITVAGHNFLVDEAREAMGIYWMNQKELAQAIPPTYTRFIGEQILNQLPLLSA
jgi:DNA (cytosine-5)-methyltransferase 1